jgi:hypothetical protein
MTEPATGDNAHGAGDDPRGDFAKIREKLNGVEFLFGSLLYVLWFTLLSYWLSHSVPKGRGRGLIIELYVLATLLVTILNWFYGPWFCLSIFCSYFTYSTIIVLLHILFLTKVFGEMESPGRSLFLFFCNVAQVVFMFAAWYQIAGLSKDGALFNSMLVLATLSYPPQSQLIVGLQITTDLVLLAVFLAHVMGKIGGGGKTDNSAHCGTSEMLP